MFRGLFGRVLAAGFAAWCGTVMAAVACAGQLALSRTVAWSVALPTVAGIHMLIGIGEGFITALVLAAVARARPELVEAESAATPQGSISSLVAYGFLIALALALFVSPLASRWPDGLDWSAEVLGFKDREQPGVLPAPIPGYEMPGVSWSVAATSAAGVVGVVVVFGLSWGVARLLVPRRPVEMVGGPESGGGS